MGLGTPRWGGGSGHHRAETQQVEVLGVPRVGGTLSVLDTRSRSHTAEVYWGRGAGGAQGGPGPGAGVPSGTGQAAQSHRGATESWGGERGTGRVSTPSSTTTRDPHPSFPNHHHHRDPHTAPYPPTKPDPTRPLSITAAPSHPSPFQHHHILIPPPSPSTSRTPAPPPPPPPPPRTTITGSPPLTSIPGGGGPSVGKGPCPTPAAPGCTSCTAGGRRTPAAAAAPSGRGAAPRTGRRTPATPQPAPSASRCPAAGLPRRVGDAWQRDESGEGAARPRGAPGERWKLLHSLRFKSRHNDAHVGRGRGTAWGHFCSGTAALIPPARAPPSTKGAAQASSGEMLSTAGLFSAVPSSGDDARGRHRSRCSSPSSHRRDVRSSSSFSSS